MGDDEGLLTERDAAGEHDPAGPDVLAGAADVVAGGGGPHADAPGGARAAPEEGHQQLVAASEALRRHLVENEGTASAAQARYTRSLEAARRRRASAKTRRGLAFRTSSKR